MPLRVTVGWPHRQGLRIQAIFLANAGQPRVSGQVALVSGGHLVAVAVPASAESAEADSLPEGLRHFTPAVRLNPAPQFASVEDLRAALESDHDWLVSELLWRAACAERRILLSSSGGAQGLDGEQARLVAKLAQTAKDVSRKVCLTQPALMVPATGDVHMALSLMIEAEQMFAADRALELAGRLVREHGMTLQVTPPGPIESFPIRACAVD